MNLRYTPQAMLDLQEIEDYISMELQNPDAARQYHHLDRPGRLPPEG